MQLSDDGKFALVEYVFANPAPFQTVLQAEARGSRRFRSHGGRFPCGGSSHSNCFSRYRFFGLVADGDQDGGNSSSDPAPQPAAGPSAVQTALHRYPRPAEESEQAGQAGQAHLSDEFHLQVTRKDEHRGTRRS